MIWPTPKAVCIKKQNPTFSLIHRDLLDNKLLTSIKDGVTRFNVLCVLHGITLPRGTRVDFGSLNDVKGPRGGALNGEGQRCYKPHERVRLESQASAFHGPPLTVYCLAPGGPKFFYFDFALALFWLFLNTFGLRRINFLLPYYRPDMQKHGYRPVVMSPVSPGLLRPMLFPSIRAEASLAFAQS
jgi:hypothetical protein